MLLLNFEKFNKNPHDSSAILLYSRIQNERIFIFIKIPTSLKRNLFRTTKTKQKPNKQKTDTRALRIHTTFFKHYATFQTVTGADISQSKSKSWMKLLKSCPS